MFIDFNEALKAIYGDGISAVAMSTKIGSRRPTRRHFSPCGS